MVKLGDKVRDSISGFEGVATSRTEFLYGCVRVCVEPQGLHDGKPIDSQYFDEQRLCESSPAPVGGPGPVPPPRDCPRR